MCRGWGFEFFVRVMGFGKIGCIKLVLWFVFLWGRCGRVGWVVSIICNGGEM